MYTTMNVITTTRQEI